MRQTIAAAMLLLLAGACSSGGVSFDSVNPFSSSACAPDPCAPTPEPCAPTPEPCAPAVASQPTTQPPVDAAPGEVYCWVRVPPVTKTVTEQVMVSPASCRQVWVEPVNEQVQERVCVKQPSTRQVTIPAEFKDVSEQVCVAPGRTEWRRVDCEPSSLGANEEVGACWTLVEVPPQYRTDTKRVCVRPESCRTEQIPGQYEMQTKTVCVKPGYYKQVPVDAVYETRTREVMVQQAKWEWRRTSECEVPGVVGGAQPAATGSPDMPAADGDNALPAAPAPAADSNTPPSGELPPLDDPLAPSGR